MENQKKYIINFTDNSIENKAAISTIADAFRQVGHIVMNDDDLKGQCKIQHLPEPGLTMATLPEAVAANIDSHNTSVSDIFEDFRVKRRDVLSTGKQGIPKVPSTSIPWNIQMVNAQTLWDMGIDGKGVSVAVIDSGISYSSLRSRFAHDIQ